MSAYINKLNGGYQVISYNSLYAHNSSKTKHLKTCKTYEEAKRIMDKVNKEEEKKYFTTQNTIEEWARMHQTDYTLLDISHKFNIPLKYVKKKLKKFSETSDWYDYTHARKHSSIMEKYRTNVNDETTANVYQTFIQTMKSLGKTTAQAWQEIYKITGEIPPDFKENV